VCGSVPDTGGWQGELGVDFSRMSMSDNEMNENAFLMRAEKREQQYSQKKQNGHARFSPHQLSQNDNFKTVLYITYLY
jgi:hypothetical protein